MPNVLSVAVCAQSCYEGRSICNENVFITPSINALGFYGLYETKYQNLTFQMMHNALFYLSYLLSYRLYHMTSRLGVK